jgi:hypothetical protein
MPELLTVPLLCGPETDNVLYMPVTKGKGTICRRDWFDGGPLARSPPGVRIYRDASPPHGRGENTGELWQTGGNGVLERARGRAVTPARPHRRFPQNASYRRSPPRWRLTPGPPKPLGHEPDDLTSRCGRWRPRGISASSRRPHHRRGLRHRLPLHELRADQCPESQSGAVDGWPERPSSLVHQHHPT